MVAVDVKLPPQVQQKIQSYHSATNEILRHFWSSWEPYKADKNLRMIEGLKKQQEKLKEILVAVVSYEGDPERCKQVKKRLANLRFNDKRLKYPYRRL